MSEGPSKFDAILGWVIVIAIVLSCAAGMVYLLVNESRRNKDLLLEATVERFWDEHPEVSHEEAYEIVLEVLQIHEDLKDN